MSRVIKAGTTDVSVVIRIIDSSDGTPETGVTSATTGLDLEYRREGAASTDLTESDLSALTDAHSDGGMLHIGNGYYRVDLPDAACAAGVTGVLVHGTATGMVVIGEYIQLVAYDPFDTVRLGLTALPNAAADAAGGLVISDAGGFDIDNRTMSATAITNAEVVYNTDFATNYDATNNFWYSRLADGVTHGGTSTSFTLGGSSAGGIFRIVNSGGPACYMGGTTYGLFADASAGYGFRAGGSIAGGYFVADAASGHGAIFEGFGGADDIALDGSSTIDGTSLAAIYSDTTIVVSDTTAINTQTTTIASDLVIVASDLLQVYSDTTIVVSDTTAIHTQTTTIASDLVIVASDLLQVYSDTTIIASDLVQVYSDTTIVVSDTTAINTQATTIASDLVIIASDLIQVYSDTTIIVSDTTAIHTQTTTIASDLVIVASDLLQVYSDTTVIASDLVQVYSDTTAIHSDTTAMHTQTTTIASDLVIVASDVLQVYSDTTIISADGPNRFTKNTAFTGFSFVMIDSTDDVSGKTGLTVTAERSIDGAAFASCANSVTEIGNGAYKIDLAATDMNGDAILLKFTASGANARFISIITQPT